MPRKRKTKPTPKPENEEYEGRFTLDADTVADAMHSMLPMDLQVFCERLAMRSGPYVREALLRALEYT